LTQAREPIERPLQDESSRVLIDYGFMSLSKNGVGRASSLTARVQWELR